jgi:hypothetical protein
MTLANRSTTNAAGSDAWRTFERAHRAVRASVFLQRGTILARALLFLGFVAPGCTKLLGRDFAPGIDARTPMGAFFVAFHGTGSYYPLVGLVQVIASFLLLSRRTALLGAVIYLPVIGNIFALVTATRFSTGTEIVTGMMTLACLWLLAWDAHRLTPLCSERMPFAAHTTEPALWDLFVPTDAGRGVRRTVRLGFVLGLGAGLGLTLFARALSFDGLAPMLLAVALAGGALTLLSWGVQVQQRVRRRAAR